MKAIPRLACLIILATAIIFYAGCTGEDPVGNSGPDDCETDLPYVVIDSPAYSGTDLVIPSGFTFRWHSGAGEDPTSTRYLCSEVKNPDGEYDPGFDIIADLGENPERYADLWSLWTPYNQIVGEGTEATPDEEETLDYGRYYVFAVQAKDGCGRVTDQFSGEVNARIFRMVINNPAVIIAFEPYLGFGRLDCLRSYPIEPIQIPAGLELNFSWKVSAQFGGDLEFSCRYGWDIIDLDDPDQWACPFTPGLGSAAPVTFNSGAHTLYIAAVDELGFNTMRMVHLEVVPSPMDRDLLWVDDLQGSEHPDPLRTMPTETEHDQFWTELCGAAGGFIPERDIYDCAEHSFVPPPVGEIFQYRHIIWTYGNAISTSWERVVDFYPESMMSCFGTSASMLHMFLAKGGGLWTNGRADRRSGLAAIFPALPLLPASFRDEMGLTPEDTTGTNSIGQAAYGVSVVDKVLGNHKVIPGISRTPDRDALRFALKETDDPLTSLLNGLPDTLGLWDEIICPECFFDPYDRGFTYVEMYNPEYYMLYCFKEDLPHFHPLYRMRSRNVLSHIDWSVIALWVTRYSHYEGGPGPASVHFGVPLWFFDHESVEQIRDVIFEEWGI